jgi:triphosphatase
MRSTSKELKLELTPQQLQRVSAHPALDDLTVGQPQTRTLRSIYFDTPDHRLRARGISLRLRSIGDQWLQTIKAGNGLEGTSTTRDALESVLGQPEPDVGAIKNDRVRRTIEKALKTSTLEAQFETVVTRTTRKLHSDKGDLELALDEGVLRAGGLENQVCEAELELKSGSPECLIETAAALFATEPIRLTETSKTERGYNLVLRRPDHGIVPQKARQVALEGNHSCAEALGLFLQSAIGQVVANRQAVLETDDPEAVHQLRIGLRRLRSALRAFRPLNDTPAAREFEQHARELARSVGKLRNADVFIENIYAPVAAHMKGERGFDDLRAALVSHRAACRDESRSALTGDQWSKLQLYFVLWPQTLGDVASLQVGVADFAGLALSKCDKKVAKHGKKIATSAPERRHEMRKALKNFRYTAEFFASLYERRKVDAFVKELKQLQDTFGYVNDVAMAKELRDICEHYSADNKLAQWAAGYVLGWHEVNARHIWDGVPKTWRHAKKRASFWD